jgi:hypothetical protein
VTHIVFHDCLLGILLIATISVLFFVAILHFFLYTLGPPFNLVNANNAVFESFIGFL